MMNNIKNFIGVGLFLVILCFILLGCGAGTKSSSITSSIISPSTAQSCLNMESGGVCYLQLNITKNINHDLSMSYTMNPSGIAQPLPDGYVVSSLSQCVSQMNNNMNSTCFVNVEYNGGSPGVSTNLYFMICDGLCTSPGNPVAITKVPISLNAIQ